MPMLRDEIRTCEYHSHEWETLVELGFHTVTVEEWGGRRYAKMLRQTYPDGRLAH